MSFLYIIASSSEGPVKLGFSADPQKRLKQLQTGSALVLSLHHVEEVDSARVKIAERALHKLLGHKRLKGEWFNLSVEEAVFEVVHVRMCEG